MRDPIQPNRILSILESSHNIPASSRTQLSSIISRLLAQAESSKLTDPVAKVLFQRLKTHIFNRISASSSSERVKAASTATEGLSTTGLPEFVSQVSRVVEELGHVSDVDRQAHGAWYKGITEEEENSKVGGSAGVKSLKYN
jgi:hypothetical protein